MHHQAGGVVLGLAHVRQEGLAGQAGERRRLAVERLAVERVLSERIKRGLAVKEKLCKLYRLLTTACCCSVELAVRLYLPKSPDGDRVSNWA